YSVAIACGIHNHLGEVVAAINLSGPESVMDSPVARERFRESLQECAQAIARELGGNSIK
ncbi:IclR family transcriptional regulator domain-containing protein, partial [Pseudomonas aeruginosa]|nr:IclR family transcriptional regulator [Pseudomonas aeruginosa]